MDIYNISTSDYHALPTYLQDRIDKVKTLEKARVTLQELQSRWKVVHTGKDSPRVKAAAIALLDKRITSATATKKNLEKIHAKNPDLKPGEILREVGFILKSRAYKEYVKWYGSTGSMPGWGGASIYSFDKF